MSIRIVSFYFYLNIPNYCIDCPKYDLDSVYIGKLFLFLHNYI